MPAAPPPDPPCHTRLPLLSDWQAAEMAGKQDQACDILSSTVARLCGYVLRELLATLIVKEQGLVCGLSQLLTWRSQGVNIDRDRPDGPEHMGFRLR